MNGCWIYPIIIAYILLNHGHDVPLMQSYYEGESLVGVEVKMAYLVEQIDNDLSLISDYDQALSSKEKLDLLLKALKKEKIVFDIRKINNMNCPVISTDKKLETLILYKQITYLGKPHDTYKKRIQIPPKWLEIYNAYKNKYNIIFCGIYKYHDNVVFVDFDLKQYVSNKANNSSAHVYTNDLYQALTKGVFIKKDKNKNTIQCFTPDLFCKHIMGTLENTEDDILRLIKKFNETVPFNKRVIGKEAYASMKSAGFKDINQSEWPGFYLEFLYSTFSSSKDSNQILKYSKNKSKDAQQLDFDLWSAQHNLFCDLKASSKTVKKIILNDQTSMVRAIENHGRLWYIVYEHETVKDSDLDFETTIYWNTLRGKKNLLSYSEKMKGEVIFKSMVIVELNIINYKSALKIFKQGKNSNGKDRQPKFSLSKHFFNNDNFVIYRYDA